MLYKIAYFSVLSLILIFAGCSSSTWEDARDANTYEAYQAYIKAHPNGEYVSTAKNRSDSLYWKSISNDTSATAFSTYLDMFPDGQFRSEAQIKRDQALRNGLAQKGRVTGTNIIIRSDHTTESSSAGVIAKKGTVVQILDHYSSGNSSEAILKRSITITANRRQITLPEGKAVRITTDLNDSVKASFSTPEYGATEATISKDDIEAMSGERWYKVRTNDEITGWVYGKFIEEM